MPTEGRRRVVIEGVIPEIDSGRFPIKRVVGENVVVEADIFADGHDLVGAALRYRREEDAAWLDAPMQPLGNDRWRGEFVVGALGRYRYTIQAWVDRFGTWRRDLEKKIEAGLDVSVELLSGAQLVARAAGRARGEDGRSLRKWARRIGSPEEDGAAVALDPELLELVTAYPDRRRSTTYGRELEVVVDPPRARFGAWYELFPRSTSPEADRHGTLADAAERLPAVARMGFDVVYLTPIHPIGRTHRKGKNNTLEIEPGDPGSPWAIGSEEGGHKSVHPDLGTIEDFDRFLARATELGLEVALDIAFQCSPDHPYVKEHPEWFRLRADGTVQYAENPPKKYQDIYPLDFETESWAELWDELKGVVDFWLARGVRIFRVDNPHTKPWSFWEWLIGEIKSEHPEVIFLSEAFTRPRVMERLAKLGFTQSYTYFTWRNTKWELEQYFGRELPEVRDYFRPNLWPNTPDILTEYLQTGGRPAFMVRLILAATLGASYGIYGPAFELCENRALREGSEEYLNSEKYEIRHWDVDRPDSLAELVALVNRIRRDNPALHTDRTLRFHGVDNDQLVAYSKTTEGGVNRILVVVNLDPHYPQEGWVHLDAATLGLEADQTFQVQDLLTGARYLWHGARNYVRLDPSRVPAHIFRMRSEVRTEHDFEYFL